MNAEQPDKDPRTLSWDELGRAVGQMFAQSMSDLHDQIGKLSVSVSALGDELRRGSLPDTPPPGHLDTAPGGVPRRTLAYALGQLAGQDKGRARTSRGVPVPRTRN